MSTKFYNLDLDVTLGGNSPSDYKIPSQKAMRTYLQNMTPLDIRVVSDTDGNVIIMTNSEQEVVQDLSGI